MSSPEKQDVNDCIPHLRYLRGQLSAYLMATSEMDEVLQNSAIESSLLSLRIIDEFFADDDGKPDDFKAHQFGSPCATILENSERIAINKYLAHLTTCRKTPKSWETVLREKVPKAQVEVDNFLRRVNPI